MIYLFVLIHRYELMFIVIEVIIMLFYYIVFMNILYLCVDEVRQILYVGFVDAFVKLYIIY
jgi:hypothetical protein